MEMCATGRVAGCVVGRVVASWVVGGATATASRLVVSISRSSLRGTTSSPVPPVPKSLMQPGSAANKRSTIAMRRNRRSWWAVPTLHRGLSFMPECLNRIEPCRFNGWEHAENQPNCAGEAEGHGQRPARNVSFFQMRIGNLRDSHGEALSSQYAEQP